MAAQFDTHKYVRSLRDAGMPEEQAEKIVEAINEAGRSADLVTKSDLEQAKTALKQDIAQVRTDLKQEIGQVRTELKHDIQRLEAEIKTENAELRAELIKWIAGFVIGAVVALTGIFATLIKLLIPASS
jgi:ferritin-like metal-binding protein YciE